MLADLGFRLVEADRLAPDDSHLLVALRDRPTLDHFDPETVAYYAPAGGGAAVASIDRRTPVVPGLRGVRRALWGHVHVIDRVPVENRFLTFGGDLRLARVSPTLTIVDLCSPAPIVRWGGHSQSVDGLSEAIGAFFGRLIVPVNFVAGAAQKIDALLPEVLYRAFLADAAERAASAMRRGAQPTALDGWLAVAWARARTDGPACQAALALLDELRL